MIQTLFQFIFTFITTSMASVGAIVLTLLAWIIKSSWIAPIANWAVRRMMAGPMKPVWMTLKNDVTYIRHAYRHPQFPMTKELYSLTCFIAILLLWSAYDPTDRMIWFLEVTPVLIELGILIFIFYKHPFTPLFYKLLFIQIIVMLVGAHYTYQNVPFGNWLMDTFHLEENGYDRIFYFTQGFALAIFAREVLLRTTKLGRNLSLSLICCCITLGVCVMYEIIEWGLATALSRDGNLPKVHNIWDSHWDILSGIIGAALSLFIFSKMHDGQISRLHAKMIQHKRK